LTETLLDLVPVYGVALVFWSTLLGCFGVPAPATVSLLVAGAFVATGEMDLVPVVVSGLAGGLIGDQLGYWIGVRGGRWSERMTLRPRTAERLERAKTITTRWGGFGVFITRWALSPIGPVINVLSGMAGMGWTRFTLYTIAGKVVWVGLFVGLGLAFSRSVAEIAETSGVLAWVLVIAAIVVTIVPMVPGGRRR
jgi:membrane-associated protein